MLQQNDTRSASRWLLLIAAFIPAAADHFLPAHSAELQAVLSFAVVILFVTAVNQHYIWYLSAHHSLKHECQQKWRQAFGWFSYRRVPPARDDLTPRQLQEFEKAQKAFVWFYRRALLVVAAVCCAVFWQELLAQVPAELVAKVSVAIRGFDRIHYGLALVIAALIFSWFTGGGSRKRTWHAIQVFLHSPEERPAELGQAPGWSAKSPLGSNRRRRWILALLLFSFGMLLARIVQAQGHTQGAQVNGGLFAALFDSWSTGRYEAMAELAVFVVAASLLLLWSFLFLLHVVSGLTFFQAHRILDDDSN